MSRSALLLLALSLTSATAAEPTQPPKAADNPLPRGPKARLGTTRFRLEHANPPVALSPDARTIAVMGGWKSLALMDAVTGKVSRPIDIPDIHGGDVGYLPGGKLMKVTSPGEVVAVVNLETGRSVGEFRDKAFGHRSDSAVSADGTRAAVALNPDPDPRGERTPSRATVWDLSGSKALCTVSAVQNDLLRVGLSADGKVLATWGRHKYKSDRRYPDDAPDFTVQVWDADTGKERCRVVLRRFGGSGNEPGGFAVTAALSPDGKQLATATADTGIELFDSATGKPARRLPARGGAVKRLGYSPDGNTLAALDLGGAVQVWDLKSGARKGVVNSPVGGVAGVVFPEPGRVVAWATVGRAVALWEVPSGKPLHVPESHADAITSIVFSPDGKTVLTAGADRTVCEWDAATGARRSTTRLKLPDRARPERRPPGSFPGVPDPDTLVLSPDGKRVAVAVNASWEAEFLILDRATGTELLGMKAGKPAVPGWHFAPVFSAGGTRVFYPLTATNLRGTPHRSAVLEIDSARSLGEIPVLGLSSRPFQPAFSPDGSRVVTAAQVRREDAKNSDLVLTSWDAVTGEKRAEQVFAVRPAFALFGGMVAIAPDNRAAVVAAAADDAKECKLLSWDITTGKVVKDYLAAGSFRVTGPVAISPDGKTFAVAGRAGKDAGGPAVIRVYDMGTGDLRHELRGSEEWVTVLAFSPDGKTLASGSTDTTVLLWDLSAPPAAK